MKKIGLSMLLVFFSLGAACAGSTIKAEVDKKSVTADEEVIYKITVVSDEKDPPQVQMPLLDGFKVVSSAQSSTVSYLDKGLNTQFLYVVILAPRAAGTLKIPPAMLKTRGGSSATEAFEIEVTPGKKPVMPLDSSQVIL